MLVLTRKLGEKVVIGTDITITVLETHGSRVRIGIEAPAPMLILRGELTPEITPSTAKLPSRRSKPA